MRVSIESAQRVSMFENGRKYFKWVNGAICILAVCFTIEAAMQTPSATDPGVRDGTAGAGTAIPGLTVKEARFFQAGLDAFSEIQSVTGTILGTEPGLGPRFNMDSCIGCHAQPAAGGSSPGINPQVAVATKQGATN